MTSAELVLVWIVPGDPERREFAERGPALARAWELTPPGGKRAEPQQDLSARERARQAVPGPPKTHKPGAAIRSAVPPKTPAVGDIWYDPAGGKMLVWRGKRWHEVEPDFEDPTKTWTSVSEDGRGGEWMTFAKKTPGNLRDELTEKQISGAARGGLQKMAEKDGRVVDEATFRVKIVYDRERDMTEVRATAQTKIPPVSIADLMEISRKKMSKDLITGDRMRELMGMDRDELVAMEEATKALKGARRTSL